MIKITPNIYLDDSELQIVFVRSPGPGGQNVNKLATAAQLRFNVPNSSSLPEEIRLRLVTRLGKKLTPDGDIVIKASRYRSQERNKYDAIDRLIAILKSATIIPKKRKKTKPTRASTERRLSDKKLHGKTKSLRGKKSHREE
ncbi:MAG: alternative ribosome rescue aminoacyl-tRNA hydrolase ArfB [Gammaproteobacteria bacterium]